MAEFSNFLENELLDHVFANAAYTAPATIYMSLSTAVSSDSARGTEVSTGGYARQAVAFGTASGGVISNTAVEQFTATGANFGTVTTTNLEDASSAGNMLCYDNDFTDTVVNDGQTLEFAVGDIDVSLD
jgi:hypothetical protein